ALALACDLPLDARGQPRIPSPSQPWKRAARAGAPVAEALLIIVVRLTRQRWLIGARDLSVASAPILAWRRADPDAAVGHAPPHYPRPLLHGYRVPTLLYAAVPGRGTAPARLALPCPLSRRAFRPAPARLGGAALRATSAHRAAGCRLVGRAP